MESHTIKIRLIEKITHDVLRIVTEKPEQYNFKPGQAAEISINKEGWGEEKRPFTFTCLPDSHYLEFMIKTYPLHKGVTSQLLLLEKNDELMLHEVFGTINYKEEGVFIAGGAGVTPFISIIRYLFSKIEIGNNKLIFANKTKADIILEAELNELLGHNFINILSDEKLDGYASGQITKGFLAANCDMKKALYLCGPPAMMEAVEKQLAELNVDPKLIVKELF